MVAIKVASDEVGPEKHHSSGQHGSQQKGQEPAAQEQQDQGHKSKQWPVRGNLIERIYFARIDHHTILYETCGIILFKRKQFIMILFKVDNFLNRILIHLILICFWKYSLKKSKI